MAEVKEDYSNFSLQEAQKDMHKRDAANRTREALRLVRCIITCNNPNRRNYEGDIFTVQNAVLPEQKKYVPFGRPTHITQIMYNMLREKKCQLFKEERDGKGNKVTVPYYVDEYNIKVLDPITPEEFNAIKQRQLAEGMTANG